MHTEMGSCRFSLSMLQRRKGEGARGRRGEKGGNYEKESDMQKKTTDNKQLTTDNGQHTAGAMRNGGEFYCDMWEQYIPQSVCIVRDTRNYCAYEAACPKREAA